MTPDTAYTFTQRVKGTDNLTASDSQSVEGRTVADTGLNYETDYRKEIITFDPDVMEAGEDYTLTDDLPNGGGIIPGTTIYIRLVDDGTGNPGPVVMEVLPERPAAPDDSFKKRFYNCNRPLRGRGSQGGSGRQGVESFAHVAPFVDWIFQDHARQPDDQQRDIPELESTARR